MKTPVQKRIDQLQCQIETLESYGLYEEADKKRQLQDGIEKALCASTEKIKIGRVIEMTGLSQSSVYRKIKNGTFPKPIDYDKIQEAVQHNHDCDEDKQIHTRVTSVQRFRCGDIKTWIAKKALVKELNV